MTRGARMLLGGAAAALLLAASVPIPFGPPGGTRMILDHTRQTYIAPPCFEQAESTNYLTEATWDRARESGYRPESSCTADKLRPISVPLWRKFGEAAGVVRSPWSW